jgi:hypothetical protein
MCLWKVFFGRYTGIEACFEDIAVEAAGIGNWKGKRSTKWFVSDCDHICYSASAACPDKPMALASS